MSAKDDLDYDVPRRGGMPTWLSVAVGIVVAALVLYGAYAWATADDDLNCAQENLDRVASGGPSSDC